MHLSAIALDTSRWDVVNDLKNRDRLHRKVMQIFPPCEFNDPRRRFGILFRVEKDRILLQSSIAPNHEVSAPGYRIITTKNVEAYYSKIRQGGEYRFRLDANTSWRIEEESSDLEWIPHADVQVKKTQKRVGCGSYPERARWFEQRMAFIGARPGVYFMESLPLLQVRGGVLEATRFDGRIEVVDRERFLRALYDGVGQGKPFGLGLMSIA